MLQEMAIGHHLGNIGQNEMADFSPFKHDLSWRQSAELLDDDQVIAVAQSQGIVPALGRKSLYLHDVRISLSGCKINKKYPEFAIRYTM